MVCVQNKSGSKNLFLAESREDFGGWNFLGTMRFPEHPRLVMGLIRRNGMGKSEIRSVIMDLGLYDELRAWRFEGLDEVCL
jgi:hypothetical protein